MVCGDLFWFRVTGLVTSNMRVGRSIGASELFEAGVNAGEDVELWSTAYASACWFRLTRIIFFVANVRVGVNRDVWFVRRGICVIAACANKGCNRAFSFVDANGNLRLATFCFAFFDVRVEDCWYCAPKIAC